MQEFIVLTDTSERMDAALEHAHHLGYRVPVTAGQTIRELAAAWVEQFDARYLHLEEDGRVRSLTQEEYEGGFADRIASITAGDFVETTG